MPRPQQDSNLTLSGALVGGLTVFTCPVTKKQMISDAFVPTELCSDPEGNPIPGLRWFQSRKMGVGGEEVDVGGGGGAFGGGGADEQVDDSAETVCGIEYTFQLVAMELKAKDLKDYLMKYFPAIRERWRGEGRPKEEIKAMMGSAQVRASARVGGRERPLGWV